MDGPSQGNDTKGQEGTRLCRAKNIHLQSDSVLLYPVLLYHLHSAGPKIILTLNKRQLEGTQAKRSTPNYVAPK